MEIRIPRPSISWQMVLSEPPRNFISVTTNVLCWSASFVLAKLMGRSYMFSFLILSSSSFYFLSIWEDVSSNSLHTSWRWIKFFYNLCVAFLSKSGLPQCKPWGCTQVFMPRSAHSDNCPLLHFVFPKPSIYSPWKHKLCCPFCTFFSGYRLFWGLGLAILFLDMWKTSEGQVFGGPRDCLELD